MKSARQTHLPRKFSAALLALGVLPPAAPAQRLTADATALPPPSGRAAITARAEPADLAALRLKAERGNAIAQYNLGLAYAQGRLVPPDVLEAFIWLTLAAEGGSTGKALDSLIDSMSETQLSVARERLAAVRAGNSYLRRATAAGSPSSAEPAVAAGQGETVTSTRGGPPDGIPGPAADKDETRKLSEQLDAARRYVARLEQEVTALRNEAVSQQSGPFPNATAEITSLRLKLRNAQASMSEQAKDLAMARVDAETARIAAAKLQADLNATREANATSGSANSVAGEALAALDRERVAHEETRTQLRHAQSRLGEATAGLETARAAANSATAAVGGAAAEKERLAAALAAEAAARAEAASARDQARNAVEKSRQETATAVARSEELARELAAAVGTAQQSKAAGVEAEKERIQLQDAVRARTAELDSARRALATAQDQAAAQARELAAAREQASAARQWEARARQLESEKAALAARENDPDAAEKAARAAAAQTDAEQKLATALRSYSLLAQERDELSARLARAETAGRQAQEEAAKNRTALSELQQRVNSTDASRVDGSELDSVRRALADAQQQLAANASEMTRLREQASAAREWETRVRRLEQEKSVLAARVPDPGADEKLAKATAAQADAEQKLATALRSYTLLSQERDQLKTQLAEVESRPAPAPAPDPATVAELERMRARVDAAERMAYAAQAEIARLTQLQAAAPAPAVAGPRGAISVGEPTRPSAEPARPAVSHVSAAVTPVAVPVEPQPASVARTHTIAIGDTLSAISRRYYGTPHRWIEIFSANREVLRDERSLMVGRTLRIP